MVGFPPSLASARETLVGEKALSFALWWLIADPGSIRRDGFEFSGEYGLWKPSGALLALEEGNGERGKTTTSERLALGQPLLFLNTNTSTKDTNCIRHDGAPFTTGAVQA